jgi:hypothetical protein
MAFIVALNDNVLKPTTSSALKESSMHGRANRPPPRIGRALSVSALSSRATEIHSFMSNGVRLEALRVWIVPAGSSRLAAMAQGPTGDYCPGGHI